MKAALFLLLAVPLWAQAVLIPSAGLCPPGQIQIATQSASLGTYAVMTLSCATLGTGVTINMSVAPWTISGAPPNTCPAVTPLWQVETISLASLAAGSTSISYTTLKPPVSGILNYWYNSAILFSSASGAVAFTGNPNPVSFTLPATWSATDTITVSYQSQ